MCPCARLSAAWRDVDARASGGVRVGGLASANAHQVNAIAESMLLFSTYDAGGTLLCEQRLSFHESVRAEENLALMAELPGGMGRCGI